MPIPIQIKSAQICVRSGKYGNVTSKKPGFEKSENHHVKNMLLSVGKKRLPRVFIQ
jgi:hypothetical protein